MAPQTWRNRIVGQGTEDPEQLLANEKNWRIHPRNQQEALEAVLDEVGWVDTIIVNQRTGYVVDGHLRVALALRKHEKEVPVQYVDLDENEEALILATLDPIAAMASTDVDKLGELMRGVKTEDERIAQMLSELGQREGAVEVGAENWQDAFSGLPVGDRAPFQQMTFTVHDSQAETIKRALKIARGKGDFGDSENENGNGNALAFICEAYINGGG